MTQRTIPATMKAAITLGHGGFDQIVYGDCLVPAPEQGHVLLRVLAAAINNTDINTRLGWYAPAVKADAASLAAGAGQVTEPRTDGGWSGATPFPLIQGTDCCGLAVAAGPGVDPLILGKRVLVRSCMRPRGFSSTDTIFLGTDFNGAFAQYVAVPAGEVFPVVSQWTDVELASLPCAYGTAENMLHRAKVTMNDHVVVTGGSGGVGSAAIQLARRRGARVTAVTSAAKSSQLKRIGADDVLIRDGGADVLKDLRADVLVDTVAGKDFGDVLKCLKPGGRYVCAGAIGGHMVGFDMRDLYLGDLTLIGCTRWDEPVFPALIGYIERNEISPLIAGTYPLDQIVEAQKAFLRKEHVGKIVLVPPPAG